MLIKPTFVGNFEKHLQIQTLILIGYSSPTTLRQIAAFFLHNTQSWGPQPSCQLREKWYVLRRIKEKTFFICPIPYPRDRTASNNSPPRARRAGLVPGVARGDGNKSIWTMHYNFKNGKSSQSVNHWTKLDNGSMWIQVTLTVFKSQSL